MMSTWRQQQQQSRRVTAARARLWQEGGGQKGSTARPSALPLQQGALRGRQQVRLQPHANPSVPARPQKHTTKTLQAAQAKVLLRLPQLHASGRGSALTQVLLLLLLRPVKGTCPSLAAMRRCMPLWRCSLNSQSARAGAAPRASPSGWASSHGSRCCGMCCCALSTLQPKHWRSCRRACGSEPRRCVPTPQGPSRRCMPLAWWRAQKSLGLSSSGFCKSVRRGTGDYGGSGSAGSQMEGPHHQRLRVAPPQQRTMPAVQGKRRSSRRTGRGGMSESTATQKVAKRRREAGKVCPSPL
mmetsp:Transcript_23499/g.61130  ORF Transcript_23499/g.61130 Transcript_23499/m.61130 type:complete len:298 (+) Transcript_23499:601-1494(+)